MPIDKAKQVVQVSVTVDQLEVLEAKVSRIIKILKLKQENGK